MTFPQKKLSKKYMKGNIIIKFQKKKSSKKYMEVELHHDI